MISSAAAEACRERARKRKSKALSLARRKAKPPITSVLATTRVKTSNAIRRSAKIREAEFRARERALAALESACSGMPAPSVEALVRYRMAAPWLRF